MSDKLIIEKTISQSWKFVTDIVDQVEENLKGRDVNIVNSVCLVSTELIENAVKYGDVDFVRPDTFIAFRLEMDDDNIYITVTNRVTKNHNLEALKKHIDNLNSTMDPEALYIERLKMLVDNPESSISQLGLYKICHEGKFTLKYDYEDEKLTVRAVRTLK